MTKDFYYLDPKTKEFPENYKKQNYLDYYVQRDLAVINYLQKQPWVSKSSLVVSGHSEGSSVAAKMASISKKITHLIYVSGNPMGRIMSIIEQLRKEESNANPLAENEFKYWEKVVGDPENLNSKEDTYKATYQFSLPPIAYLKKVSIPVLVMYGTKDYNSLFNDFFHVEMIKSRKINFTFKAYIGLEHNFFPLDKNGLPN